MNSEKVVTGKVILVDVYHKVLFAFNLLCGCLKIACRQPITCVRKYISLPYLIIGLLLFLLYITRSEERKRTPRVFFVNSDYDNAPKLSLNDFGKKFSGTSKIPLSYGRVGWDNYQIINKAMNENDDHFRIDNSVSRKGKENTLQKNVYERPNQTINGSNEKSESHKQSLKKIEVPNDDGKVNKLNIPLTLKAPFIRSNPSLCSTQNISHIIMVHSQVDHFVERSIIRNSWGSIVLFPHGRTVFLIGTTENTAIQKQVDEEFMKYGDIVQGNFVDVYKNLTLKGVMGFRWISEYCPLVKAVIKADDDIVFNIHMFIERFLPLFEIYPDLIVGNIVENNTMSIIRNPESRWYVPDTEPWFVGKKTFPKYLSGQWVGLSMKVVQQLYIAAFKTPFFWIDDVYSFGLLARAIKNVTYVSIGRANSLNCSLTLDCYNNGTTPCSILMTACPLENIARENLLWNLMQSQRVSPPIDLQTLIESSPDNNPHN